MASENRKCAFAVYGKGERYERYKQNVIRGLKRHVPGVDIVELDDVYECAFGGLPEKERPYFVRMLIPVKEEFRKYDRVIWIDADTDIVSDEFAEILNVETSDDGLAAVPDIDQPARAQYLLSKLYLLSKRLDFRGNVYVNSGVMVFDLNKIDPEIWLRRTLGGVRVWMSGKFVFHDQDVFNITFDIKPIDAKFNVIWKSNLEGACLVHYADGHGHDLLDRILADRRRDAAKDRCVVVSPRHDFIRPWIRAYFAAGNTIPLVIVPGPPGDWRGDDMEYCRAAAEHCGGLVFDCSKEWKNSARLASRAVRKNVGWYTKKSILHAVASRLKPKTWAWIDDDAEVTGNLGECFDYAEKAPGFILSQFYCPGTDNRHPEKLYRSNIDPDDKVCWNSFLIFHGEANERFAADLGKEFPIEDDEIVFGYLYKWNPAWRDGFCDFSPFGWQAICKRLHQLPKNWSGKLIHYTATHAGGEVKRYWAAKADKLPPAPFEGAAGLPVWPGDPNEPVDAVFVVGVESIDGNNELRYALRNLERHCKFVRDVYICGECPDWIDRSTVKHLQWPDRFRHAKDANIIDKLRHACEAPGISKRILFCSDDQFQTKECSWEDFEPRWLKQFSEDDKFYLNKQRTWHTRLRETMQREIERRAKLGLDPEKIFYFQPHIWMPVDRDTFVDYAKWSDYEHRCDTIIASGYYNFAGVTGRPNFDHEFLGAKASALSGARHVAYNDEGYRTAVRAILEEMFPEPSKFEKAKEQNHA